MTYSKTITKATILITLVMLGLTAFCYASDSNKAHSGFDNEDGQVKSIAQSENNDEGHITSHEFILKLLDRDIEHEINQGR